nr:hypothetical protein [Acidobacteriota bacterium]
MPIPFRTRSSSSVATTTWMPAPKGGAADAGSVAPLFLQPAYSPFGRFVAILLTAAFWNGVTAIFVRQLVAGFRMGRPDWWAAIVVAVFVLFGLVLLLAVPYCLLALGNPRPHLTLSRSALRLGEPVSLEWRFTGRPGRLRR